MVKLQVDESKVRELYKSSPDWFRRILKDSAGDKLCSEKFTDRIRSFTDAYNEAPSDVRKEYDDSVTGTRTKDELAYSKIRLLSKISWEGSGPDWNNSNQYKWWPWFKLSSGFGFGDSFYDYVSTNSCVGSRLCFPSEEISNYLGNTFIEIYKDWLT